MNRQSQSGATLLITLVMLIMLTLLALSAMNSSTTNLQMVGNSQARSEALEATQRTIEKAISTPSFVETPANAIPGSCAPNTVCTDLNGDGTPELNSVLTPDPHCVQARVIKIVEFDAAALTPRSQDAACLVGQVQGVQGVEGASTSGDSLCAASVWEIASVTREANVPAAKSRVNYGITQGVGIRVKALDVASSCP